jgi:hypothetical protein
MRQYIRHPTDIPITVECQSITTTRTLRDIGYGGLCFSSHERLARGTEVSISINVVSPPCNVFGHVIWCKPDNSHFELGVAFDTEADAFKTRMVEQICYIQQYKSDVLLREGRALSDQEAAIEWVEQFADKFPSENTA